ncbi:MAG: MBL fold metallo-hydrolase [Arenicellales bacterium]
MSNNLPKTRIHTLELGPMENFIYLIEDTHSKRTAVVDPAWEGDEILNLAKSKGLTITDILLTHSHHDHINAIDDILENFDAELHLTHAEATFWGQAKKPTLHYGGDAISLGKTDIDILHTPGHTPGSACYKVDDNLITGDTMFVFGCGRCDMHGGDPNQMFDTLRKLGKLPDKTQILPGHNYAVQTTATIAEQHKGNPFMHFNHEQDFVKFRMNLHGKVRQSPYDKVSVECAHEWLEA